MAPKLPCGYALGPIAQLLGRDRVPRDRYYLRPLAVADVWILSTPSATSMRGTPHNWPNESSPMSRPPLRDGGR
eukprot:3239196-Pleurochrysis_carterae.AAC.1